MLAVIPPVGSLCYLSEGHLRQVKGRWLLAKPPAGYLAPSPYRGCHTANAITYHLLLEAVQVVFIGK